VRAPLKASAVERFGVERRDVHAVEASAFKVTSYDTPASRRLRPPRESLRPVGVRDALINVLGMVDEDGPLAEDSRSEDEIYNLPGDGLGALTSPAISKITATVAKSSFL
jgi:hypothetical protein